MKLALAIMAALLWQAGGFSSSADAPAPLAEPQHLRYERSLTLPAGVSGTACAVLDANVYAHAASPSGDDLRIFRTLSRGKPEEVPFVVSYSEARPTDAHTATMRNLHLRNGVLIFDLYMPPRPYTLVDLHLAAQNFVATAEVSGSNSNGGPAKPLGAFALFDLTQQHLARSTSFALQESTFPQLHIELHLHRINGSPFPHLSTAIVQGSTVPASREAQTLYTVVAATSKITQQGTSSVAELDVPAHVPIERVNFMLDPAYLSNFLRSVSIVAESDTQAPSQPQEVIDGEIWRVAREADAGGDPAIHATKLTIVAVLASNLRAPAAIRVEVKNGSEPLLPIKAVQLEMRQRTLCFNATSGSTYSLRYGDDVLRASVYDLGGLAELPVKPLVATLGPEEFNPHYIQRRVASTYDERNPDLVWIALLAAIAVLGAFASRHTRRQGRHR